MNLNTTYCFDEFVVLRHINYSSKLGDHFKITEILFLFPQKHHNARVLCVEIKKNMKDITDVIDEQGVLKSVRAFAYSDLSHPFSYVQFVNNEPPEK